MRNLKHPKRVLAEAKLLSSHFGNIEFDGNMILVHSFNLPSNFNKRTSKLLIVLPTDYPESPPADMYLDKGLKKRSKTPEHYFKNRYGQESIRKKGFAWYSIHFTAWQSSAKSIIRGDNLLTAANALFDALKYDEGER